MKLIPISEHQDHEKILYDLLCERPAGAAISHKKMPTWEQHCAFVANHPYQSWHLIEADGIIVGTIYLSQKPRPSVAGNEIGIFIFKEHQRKSYGEQAITMLVEMHPGERMLANIAPGNEPSLKMFEKLGFKTIQHTLSLEAE